MKEFIDKLIGRLEEHCSISNEICYCDGVCSECDFKASIEIVNELAEEYKDKSGIIDDVKVFLEEKFDYCAEQAGMNLEAECNSEIASYFRERKELYLDRANIYGEVLREIDRLSEEYKGGWIPYSTDAELPLNGQRVWLSFTTPMTSFVKSAWWIYDHFEWDNGRKVKYAPLAWKPYDVPAPYTEGE